MDGAMGSPVAQMALPAAAGYAGTRPGGAAGVNSALNTSQFMMRQAADKRVREMFGEMGPYEDPSQAVTAAGAGTTPPAASRVGDYMDMLNRSVSAGGMAALAPAMRQMTSMHKTLTGYEQPREVSAGDSLMTPSGELLGDPAPITDPHRIQGGNILNTVTGEASAAPLQSAQLDETMRYNTKRISELGTREELTGAKVATEGTRQALNSARVQKIEAEIQHEIGKGSMTKEGLSLQLTRVNEALNDPTVEKGSDIHNSFLRLRTLLADRMAAVLQAEEATKGDSTEEGSGTTVAEDGMVSSHEGLQVSPTGQVYDYVPGQGLRPR